MYVFIEAGLYLLAGLSILLATTNLWKLIHRLPIFKTEIDPIEIAHAYIALGRNKQAIDILNQALIESPGRVQLIHLLKALQQENVLIETLVPANPGSREKTAEFSYLVFPVMSQSNASNQSQLMR